MNEHEQKHPRSIWIRCLRVAVYVALFGVLAVDIVAQPPSMVGMAAVCLYGIVTPWLVACEASERFNSWSNRKGLPWYGAIMSASMLIALAIWQVLR